MIAIETCADCGHATDLHDRRAEDGECEACEDQAQVGQYAPCAKVRCQCGATGTIELHGPNDQSITICANCGSDE